MGVVNLQTYRKDRQIHGETTSPLPISIEVSPKTVLEREDLHELLPKHTRVFITDIGTHIPEEIATACGKLSQMNMIAVPHLPARRMKNHADLADRIKRFNDQGAVETLVVGGSPNGKAGEIASTMEVLNTGLLDTHGYRKIYVAGHPEGSPDFTEEVALAALEAKQRFCARSDAQMAIVTQFGFDAQAFIGWAEGLKAHNINLPVYLGFAGPTKLTTLIRYAAMCGVGNSLNFLKKRSGALTALATRHTPDDFVDPVDTHMRNNPDTNIKGLHAFPFGGVKSTAQWLQDHFNWRQESNSSTASSQ